jgi:hypothetical protein
LGVGDANSTNSNPIKPIGLWIGSAMICSFEGPVQGPWIDADYTPVRRFVGGAQGTPRTLRARWSP